MQDLDHDKMIALLHNEREGILAMCDDDKPYCLPFGYVMVDGCVHISLLPQGRKWDCIQKNPRVCFTVFSWNEDRSAWASVAVEGELELVDNLDTIKRVVQANAARLDIDSIEDYVEKRMRYYVKNQDNPNGVKTTRIIANHMGGKTNPVIAGK